MGDSATADPARAKGKSGRIAPNWMAVAAVVAMIIAIGVTLGLIVPKQHSYKFDVLVANFYSDTILVNISIDGDLKRSMNIEPGTYHSVGSWPAGEGRHTATVNYGWEDLTFSITYTHHFDQPSVKSVWMGLGPTIHLRW